MGRKEKYINLSFLLTQYNLTAAGNNNRSTNLGQKLKVGRENQPLRNTILAKYVFAT